MLISMPTGTSTIFGAFQAILALLIETDELRPLVKVARIEKFASEIFYDGGPFSCCGAAAIHGFVQMIVKTKWDQRVHSGGQTGASRAGRRCCSAP
jgi:hypothetical protein